MILVAADMRRHVAGQSFDVVQCAEVGALGSHFRQPRSKAAMSMRRSPFHSTTSPTVQPWKSSAICKIAVQPLEVATEFGPDEGDAGAVCYRRRSVCPLDLGVLSDAVDGEGDVVRGPPGLDQRAALCAVQGEGHREERLQRIALGAASRET